MEVGFGKPQKENSSLSGRATKREWGLHGCATKEKITFFNVKKKIPMATKQGGGLRALVNRKELILRLPFLNM